MVLGTWRGMQERTQPKEAESRSGSSKLDAFRVED